MNTERWKIIKDLFARALELDREEYASFLNAECEDAEMRKEVAALLASHHGTGQFMERPASQMFLPDRLIETLSPGDVIGAYCIVRLLNRGGMGSVYLAEREDGQFEQTVAIKVIRPGLDSGDILTRFEHERQILARLNHPNIAALQDGGLTDDGRPYFIMEYVDGLTLTEYCDRHQKGTEDRLRLFQTVCSAVRFAHQNLIVHRDLKPDNILVTGEGTVKLLDFGIAKIISSDQASTRTGLTAPGLRLMTREYAAPEQVRGETITTATDVYQLGILLYELLTGTRPFDLSQRARVELERVILETDPPRPSTRVMKVGQTRPLLAVSRSATLVQLRRQLIGDLDNIILMAVRKEPDRRYTTVDQLVTDIRFHLEGRPVRAHAESTVYLLSKFVGRNRGAVAAGLLIVLSLAAGLAGTAWQARQTARERSHVEEMNAFILGLFEANDPNQTLGDTLTVRDVLDRGAARLDTSSTLSVDLRVDLIQSVAGIYRNLGLYARADSILAGAIQLAHTALADDHVRLFDLYHTIGQIRENEGLYEAADSLFDLALEEADKTGERRAFRRAAIQADRGVVAKQLGRLEESVEWYRMAIKTFEISRTKRDPLLADVFQNLSTSLALLGRFEEAEKAIHRALDIRTSIYGEVHLDVASGLNNLGEILRKEGNLTDATSTLGKARDIFVRLLGENDTRVADIDNNLGVIAMSRGHNGEAIRRFKHVRVVKIAQLGPTHPMVGQVHVNLGIVLQAAGRFDEASESYDEAERIFSVSLPKDHWIFGVLLNNRADLASTRGETKQAADMYERALRKYRVSFGKDNPRVAYPMTGLGLAMDRLGRYQQAESHLRAALELRVRGLSPESILIQETGAALGRCLLHQARWAEADTLLLAAYRTYSAEQGRSSTTTQEILRDLIESLEHSYAPLAKVYRDSLVVDG